MNSAPGMSQPWMYRLGHPHAGKQCHGKGPGNPGQQEVKYESAAPWQLEGPRVSWGSSGAASPARQGMGLSLSALH